MKIFYQTFETSIGPVSIFTSEDKLLSLGLPGVDTRKILNRLTKIYSTDEVTEQTTPLMSTIISQLNQYLNHQRTEFDLPLELKGTAFQQKVWDQMAKIKYGQTLSYKALAENIGNPKAIRALGTACGDNPIPIIIPCHRVVGSNGQLTGYVGGLSLKEKLLKLEGDISIDNF